MKWFIGLIVGLSAALFVTIMGLYVYDVVVNGLTITYENTSNGMKTVVPRQ